MVGRPELSAQGAQLESTVPCVRAPDHE
eukprot:COSAG02_NODE_43554_length_373_cov_1.649635_1_plen_27_part_01